MALNWHTMRHAALWGWHQLLTLALVLLVLLAIVVGLGRQFAPVTSRYHAEIEAKLTQVIGLPVRIERVTGSWQGVTPFFLVEGLRLQNPAAPASTLLLIPRLELRPSLWQSLISLEPRVDVRVRGLDLHFDQLPDGQLRLREMSSLAQTDPAAAKRAVQAALRQPLLAIEDSRLELALQGYPVLHFNRINLVNRNDGRSHRLAGDVLLEGMTHPAAINMSLQGEPTEWHKGALVAWLSLPAMRLDAWLPRSDVAGIGLKQVTGGGEFWLHFTRGRLVALQARPRLSQAVFRSRYGNHVLNSVRGELAWARTDKGWTLSAQHLAAQVDNIAWPASAVAISGNSADLTVAVGGLDVATAAVLVNRLPLPDAIAGWIREATPVGRIPAVMVSLSSDAEGQWSPRLVSTRFERIGLHATTRFPGGNNLTGWARWTPGQTLLSLDTKAGGLDLRQVFREPVALDYLRGVVRMRASPERWHLESDRLLVKNPDATGQAVLRVDIPRADPHAAELSLVARLTNARVASTWRYVPWPPAGDKAIDWLRRALVAGTLTRGDFLFDGPLAYRDGQPSMRQLMRFEVSGTTLDYLPGWPALQKLDGVVTIDGRSLNVDGQQAGLLDATVAHALRADIPDLRHPRLTVSGELQSSGPDLVRLFRESPLREHTGSLSEALQLKGGLNGQLALDIPLAVQTQTADVSVKAVLDGNQLFLPGQSLLVDGLRGEVRYTTRAGLTADALSGRMLGAPVTARISSAVRKGVLQQVQVDVDGRVGVTALQGWLGGPLWQALSGEAPYQARIRIPAGKQPAQLQVTSSLAGMSILLPAPLGKGAAPLPFRLQSSLGGVEQMARLQLGHQLSGGLVWRDGVFNAALLRLDSNDVGWPSAPGIEIEGRVPRLSLADWQPWLDRFQKGTARTAASASLPGLTRLEIEAREMEANGWRLGNARLSVKREADAWRVGLTNEDLAGTVLWPDADGKECELAITRLHWPLPGMPDTVAAVSGNAALPSTRPVSVSVDGLRMRQYPGFGLMSGAVRLSPSPYGVRMDELKLRTAVAAFDGRLDWQWRGGDSTRLRGVATSQDVAGLLKALRFAPSMDSPKARAEVDLSWPSSPQSIALKGLDGTLAMRIENGRLLNVNAATSASRVFGLVDIENIRRRLRGDFSDVLLKGLSFDAVTLNGNLQSGQMPRAVFDLKGPSLSAHGEGQLDLAGQKIDQLFTVNVPVSSAVPLAAVVVAGPLVGGAVAAAELALKRQIEKATVMHYRISGDWSSPLVEKVGAKSRPAIPPQASGAQP